jgi:hypothetical protein
MLVDTRDQRERVTVPFLVAIKSSAARVLPGRRRRSARALSPRVMAPKAGQKFHLLSVRSSREMPRKRKSIYNPRTGVYYSIRQRSTSAGRRGSIKGKRSRRRKKKGFWDSLFG